MDKLTLVTIPSDKNESFKKKQLIGNIQKKRALLKKLVAENEMLSVNLKIAEREYMARVGSLVHKDNRLDLEIIRLRNILHFMTEGLTYEEAVKKVEQTYYAEELREEMEKEKIFYNNVNIPEPQIEEDPKTVSDLKKIWKRLITKFHPDLTQDQKEKQKREEIMKQINSAYEDKDYDRMVKIENENTGVKKMTVDNLEDILVGLILEINKQRELYTSLKQSEWFYWMTKIEKAKKKSLDIFAETEKRLLNDIVAKFDQIKAINLKIQNLQKNK